MNFVEKLFDLLSRGVTFIGEMIWKLISFLAKPIQYLYYFLDGIFYCLFQLFYIVVEVIKIFVALFQFIIALILGLGRTITSWLSFKIDTSYVYYPSTSGSGIQVVLDLIEPLGLLSIVPMILQAVVWFFFIIKILSLFGGSIDVNVGGR